MSKVLLTRGSASVTTVNIPLIFSCRDDMNTRKTNERSKYSDKYDIVDKVVRGDIYSSVTRKSPNLSRDSSRCSSRHVITTDWSSEVHVCPHALTVYHSLFLSPSLPLSLHPSFFGLLSLALSTPWVYTFMIHFVNS